MSAFQLLYSTVCDECDSVMGVGEWGDLYGTGQIKHLSQCPRQPKTCPDCFLQHAGEC